MFSGRGMLRQRRGWWVSIGCERVDVRWKSSQNKAKGEWDRANRVDVEDHCGHYEDNREQVQRHDPIATVLVQ